MRETYKGYTLLTISRALTPKELFQAVRIWRDDCRIHDCLIGDLDNAKRFVDCLEASRCNCR